MCCFYFPRASQQEIGRAGRDGRPSLCHVLYSSADAHRSRSLAHSDGFDQATVLRILTALFPPQSSASNTSRHIERDRSIGDSSGDHGDHSDDGSAEAVLSPFHFTALSHAEYENTHDLKELVLATILTQLELVPVSAVESFLTAFDCVVDDGTYIPDLASKGGDRRTGTDTLAKRPPLPRDWCRLFHLHLITSYPANVSTPYARLTSSFHDKCTLTFLSQTPEAAALKSVVIKEALKQAGVHLSAFENEGSNSNTTNNGLSIPSLNTLPFANSSTHSHTSGGTNSTVVTVTSQATFTGTYTSALTARKSNGTNAVAGVGDDAIVTTGGYFGPKQRGTYTGGAYSRGGGRGGFRGRGGYGKGGHNSGSHYRSKAGFNSYSSSKPGSYYSNSGGGGGAHGSGGRRFGAANTRGSVTCSISSLARALCWHVSDVQRALMQLRMDGVIGTDWSEMSACVHSIVSPGRTVTLTTDLSTTESDANANTSANAPGVRHASVLVRVRVRLHAARVLSRLAEYLTWRMTTLEQAGVRKVDIVEKALSLVAVPSAGLALKQFEGMKAAFEEQTQAAKSSKSSASTNSGAVLQSIIGAYFDAIDDESFRTALLSIKNKSIIKNKSPCLSLSEATNDDDDVSCAAVTEVEPLQVTVNRVLRAANARAAEAAAAALATTRSLRHSLSLNALSAPVAADVGVSGYYEERKPTVASVVIRMPDQAKGALTSSVIDDSGDSNNNSSAHTKSREAVTAARTNAAGILSAANAAVAADALSSPVMSTIAPTIAPFAAAPESESWRSHPTLTLDNATYLDLTSSLFAFVKQHVLPALDNHRKQLRRHARGQVASATASGTASSGTVSSGTAPSGVIMTARTVARVFHGLPSPAFPLEAWRRTGEWGQWVRVPFEAVLCAAETAMERAGAGEWARGGLTVGRGGGLTLGAEGGAAGLPVAGEAGDAALRKSKSKSRSHGTKRSKAGDDGDAAVPPQHKSRSKSKNKGKEKGASKWEDLNSFVVDDDDDDDDDDGDDDNDGDDCNASESDGAIHSDSDDAVRRSRGTSKGGASKGLASVSGSSSKGVKKARLSNTTTVDDAAVIADSDDEIDVDARAVDSGAAVSHAPIVDDDDFTSGNATTRTQQQQQPHSEAADVDDDDDEVSQLLGF